MKAVLTQSIRKHIFLHPADKEKKQNAIKAALLKDKKKHSDRLGGALLDVNSLKVVGNRHMVVDGYLSMEVVADVQVFSPIPGMKLEGVINKCSKTHVGCLVLDTFNAMLSIPKGSPLNPQLGDSCLFDVTEVVVDEEILFLRGILRSVEKVSEIADSTQLDSINQEDKFFEEELSRTTEPSEDTDANKSTVDALDSSVFNDSPQKKKKRKHKEITEDDSLNTSSSSPKKKKAKRKSS